MAGGSTGLLRVTGAGGEVEVLTLPDPARDEGEHFFPSVVPGGRAVLFTIAAAGGTSADVAVLDLRTGEHRKIIPGGSEPRYVDTGHIIYAAAGALRAVRFDATGLRVLSAPVPVVEGVLTQPATNYAIARSGTLA
jgi:hypothetical protein